MDGDGIDRGLRRRAGLSLLAGECVKAAAHGLFTWGNRSLLQHRNPIVFRDPLLTWMPGLSLYSANECLEGIARGLFAPWSH